MVSLYLKHLSQIHVIFFVFSKLNGYIMVTKNCRNSNIFIQDKVDKETNFSNWTYTCNLFKDSPVRMQTSWLNTNVTQGLNSTPQKATFLLLKARDSEDLSLRDYMKSWTPTTQQWCLNKQHLSVQINMSRFDILVDHWFLS